MQCIRNGLPHTGLRLDTEVGGALKSAISSSGLEAVSELLRLGSQIQSLTTSEYEIPYSGGDMMDVVSAVGGRLCDQLDLQDSCPLPAQKGGAVNVAVETAVEVMNLARDSLEQSCIAAVASEEPLVLLAGKLPLQAFLLASRARFTQTVDGALESGKPLVEVRREIEAIQALVSDRLREPLQEVAEGAGEKQQQPECESAVSKRERAALEVLQVLLAEQAETVAALAAVGEEGEEEVQKVKQMQIWEDELRFYRCSGAGEEESQALEARCAGRAIPLAFEYDPRPLPTYAAGSSDLVRTCRRTFAEAFDLQGPRARAGPKVLLVSDRLARGKTSLVHDVCSTLGVTPVALSGAELQSRDTFWHRVAKAAKSSSGGALAVVIISEAHRATRSLLEIAVNECRQHSVGLCLTYDPDALDFDMQGCVSTGFGPGHMVLEAVGPSVGPTV